MKKNIKWIVLSVVLVVLIGGAYVLYDKLGDKVMPMGSELVENNSTIQTQEGQNNREETKPFYNAAPDFTVIDEKGNEVKLSDYRGKPVVLNFWTTWCYYCKEEMPTFDKLCKEYKDVQFLMVNATDNVSETVDVAKQFKKEAGYQFPIFFDTERQATIAYGVSSYPQSFFIDKNGNLVASQLGMMQEKTLRKGISMITE